MSNEDPACNVHPDEVTEPIGDLEQLLQWDAKSVNRCLVGQPLNDTVKEFKASTRPRTLVCHDMMGGYLEDKFAHGCAADTVYYIREWPYMDIFCYFSHHLVTIPPVGWINAAHVHNVPVLGTFITEWEPGERICEEFLSDSKKLVTVAEQLALIAAAYKFDGWLLNIENPVKQVENLRSFAGLLTSKCKEVIGQSALVIWYDSVTKDGRLQWQNALNEQNKSYFDVCDGIFLNYGWNGATLETSVTHARDRLVDVYVGVDVFGRGVLGGGGLNCIEALNVIRQHGLSAAIFGPGWVYERFWALMTAGLYCNEIVRLPFRTTFVPGKRWYPPKVDAESGQIVQRCFLSLRDQELQPHWFCPRLGQKLNDTGKTDILVPLEPQFVHEYTCENPSGFLLKAIIDKDTRLRLFCCDSITEKPLRAALTHGTKAADVQLGLAFVFCSSDKLTVNVVPNTLTTERVESLFDANINLDYCEASTTEVQPAGDTMIADISPLNGSKLLHVDLLVFPVNNGPRECVLASFALSYVEE